MKAADFIAPGWQADLDAAGLGGFEDFWQAPMTLVDDRNIRGEGWSEVGYLDLQRAAGPARIYVKRQQNYFSRTPAHPLRGEPTLAKEYRTIAAFRDGGVGTLDTVYFSRQADGRAILVTAELKGYRPLDEWLQDWHENPSTRPKPALYWHIIEACADLVAAMHDLGYHHRCLYPKHLFLRLEEGSFDVRVIDLEKARAYGIPGRWRAEELAKLWRRIEHVSRSDGLRFLLRYRRQEQLDAGARRFLRTVLKRAGKKGT